MVLAILDYMYANLQHHKGGWKVLAIFRLHICESPFEEELCIKKEKNIQIWGDFSPLNNSL